MSEAPERIWISQIPHDLSRSDDLEPMGFAWNKAHGKEPVEYTRADLPAAVTVKPLVWEWSNDYGTVCRAATSIGTYSISDDEDRPSAMFCDLHLTDDGDCTRYAIRIVDDYLEPEEVQAFAQADYERRILSQVNVTPAPVAGWRYDTPPKDRMFYVRDTIGQKPNPHPALLQCGWVAEAEQWAAWDADQGWIAISFDCWLPAPGAQPEPEQPSVKGAARVDQIKRLRELIMGLGAYAGGMDLARITEAKEILRALSEGE